MCMCVVWVYGHMCMCAPVEVKVDVRSSPPLIFHSFTEAEYLRLPEHGNRANLVSHLALGTPCLHLLRLKLQVATTSWPCVFLRGSWGSKLLSPRLCYRLGLARVLSPIATWLLMLPKIFWGDNSSGVSWVFFSKGACVR